MSISATIDPPVSKGLTGRARRSEAARPVKCQICGAVTRPGLDLGHQPVGDLILSPGQLNRPEIFYPMQVHHCAQCGHFIRSDEYEPAPAKAAATAETEEETAATAETEEETATS